MYSRIHIRIRHPVFAIRIVFVTWCIRSSPSRNATFFVAYLFSSVYSSSLSFIFIFYFVCYYIYHIRKMHHCRNSLLCFKSIMFNLIIIVAQQPSGYTVLAFHWQYTIGRHFNCYPFIIYKNLYCTVLEEINIPYHTMRRR